ncbi:hypothetical protein EW145_g3205, partial [Phellinidium pouzarii]
PAPGVNMKDRPHFVRACTEPFTVSLRHVSPRNIKFIWWFVSRTVGDGVPEHRNDTQMRSENFESVMHDVDVDEDFDEALDASLMRLTYANDRDIAKTAIRLVQRTYPDWFSKTSTKLAQLYYIA